MNRLLPTGSPFAILKAALGGRHDGYYLSYEANMATFIYGISRITNGDPKIADDSSICFLPIAVFQ